jgi:peptide/nickel transport system ATP-binding protein
VTEKLFEVTDLSVAYGSNLVVYRAGFELHSGRIMGLVGESGCGKSTTALASIGYIPPGGVIKSGRSILGGKDLLSLGERDRRVVWGRDVAYVAQNAGTALNPALRIRRQIGDTLRFHRGLKGDAALERKLEILESVGIPDPKRALEKYPHQFSGGQQQRIALAVALAAEPRVLVLDEPTTGLDVTTQAMVSRLLKKLVTTLGLAALYVSHDIALLSELADDLIVMYAGEIAESGPMKEVTGKPRHPYTRALLAAVPRTSESRELQGIPGQPPPYVSQQACSYVPRCPYAVNDCAKVHPDLYPVGPNHGARCLRVGEIADDEALGPVGQLGRVAGNGWRSAGLLDVQDLVCTYRLKRQTFTAVEKVSFSLGPGETLGIVGESGSGKSTLLRAVAGLHVNGSGPMTLEGAELPFRVGQRPPEMRRRIQLVFQDPVSSLNPRETVRQIITRPLRLLRDDVGKADELPVIESLLRDVRLSRAILDRYPWEMSGGQQQRVALARAFACEPDILLCDEVTSALDVSVQATVIELIRELAEEHHTAVLFVSHDLAVVRSIVNRMLVMKDGVVCESGAVDDIFHSPQHHYTKELLESVPHA